MSANPEKEDPSEKKSKGKPEAEYIPPPLPVEPEAPKSFVPSADFVQTLRKATPYVPPSTTETRSKVFSKLAAAEENATEGAIEGGTPPNPREPQEPKVHPPSSTPLVASPVGLKPSPPTETRRIIIKPIKEPPKRVEKVPTVNKRSKSLSTPADAAPAKELPDPATSDISIYAENPWGSEKGPKKSEDAMQIQNPWGTATEPTLLPSTLAEQPIPGATKFDWKAIRSQSDVLWNYIGKLLDWLQDMVVKADLIQKYVLIERVYTIRNKIEQNFGITFPDMETDNLTNVEILRIAMEYVRYLKENFNPNYFFCPSCNHILAFYYPVPALPCPTCGAKLEPTSPERE